MLSLLNALLTEVAEKLALQADPERIILFGPHATGDARPEDPVDLMVIVAEPFGPGRSRWEEVKRLRAAIGSYPFRVNIVLFSQDQVDRFSRCPNHLMTEALADGEVLYERG